MKCLIVLLLVGMLLMTNPALASAGGPEFQATLVKDISTRAGGPGTEITLSGSGAVPGRNIIVTLAPRPETTADALVSQEIMPNQDGTFSATLTIPADIPAGAYYVRAEQYTPLGFLQHFYWNTFTVTGQQMPAMDTSPTLLPETGRIDFRPTLFKDISTRFGGPGTEITVSGTGAAPGQNVIVTLTPQPDTTVGAWVREEITPNQDGTFSATLTVPADIPGGVYYVRAEQHTPLGFLQHYFWNTFTVAGMMPGMETMPAPAQP